MRVQGAVQRRAEEECERRVPNPTFMATRLAILQKAPDDVYSRRRDAILDARRRLKAEALVQRKGVNSGNEAESIPQSEHQRAKPSQDIQSRDTGDGEITQKGQVQDA